MTPKVLYGFLQRQGGDCKVGCKAVKVQQHNSKCSHQGEGERVDGKKMTVVEEDGGGGSGGKQGGHRGERRLN